ncbi:MAG TPA: O-antigen polysaccharide polymerase Wzy, partial [Candidatus Angelobacter sp.]|nr:O-antigen polysaccharide polymerase Wzy [Candidatus Angelobacter sp.]
EALMGATSTLLAHVSGRERVLFERSVFAAQWGQNETGTGSANSVYITEAYVNFGYAGVVIFSLMIGSILRLFAKSRDPAFQSLWILFCLNIYFAGLIGTLFSNGFVLLLFFSVFIKLRAAALTRPKQNVIFNYA